MRCGKLGRCIKQLYYRFLDDEIPALGAQLAYYFILSFFPFLIFLITLIGYSPISSEGVLGSLEEILPREAYILIENTIWEVVETKNGGFISFGIITTLWIASNGVGAVIHGLNKAYDQEETRPFWRVKGIAVFFTVLLSTVIIFTFILLVFGGKIEMQLVKRFGIPTFFDVLWNIIRYGLTLLMMFITFAVLYRYTPNRKLRLKEVMPGSLFTTAGWVVISMSFAYYVDNFGNYSRIYGSIGGVMILLIWLYISAMIILLGGELNATLALDREGIQKSKGKRY